MPRVFLGLTRLTTLLFGDKPAAESLRALLADWERHQRGVPRGVASVRINVAWAAALARSTFALTLRNAPDRRSAANAFGCLVVYAAVGGGLHKWMSAQPMWVVEMFLLSAPAALPAVLLRPAGTRTSSLPLLVWVQCVYVFGLAICGWTWWMDRSWWLPAIAAIWWPCGVAVASLLPRPPELVLGDHLRVVRRLVTPEGGLSAGAGGESLVPDRERDHAR